MPLLYQYCLSVNQHFFSGRRTPAVQGVVPIQAAAMIIIFNAAQRVNSGKLALWPKVSGEKSMLRA